MWFEFNAAAEQWQDVPVPADLLVSGEPQWQVWRGFASGTVQAGRFRSTPGRWKWGLLCWEYFLVRAGKMVIYPRDAVAILLVAGDSFVVQPGFQGEVEVVEDLIQEFFADSRK